MSTKRCEKRDAFKCLFSPSKKPKDIHFVSMFDHFAVFATFLFRISAHVFKNSKHCKSQRTVFISKLYAFILLLLNTGVNGGVQDSLCLWVIRTGGGLQPWGHGDMRSGMMWSWSRVKLSCFNCDVWGLYEALMEQLDKTCWFWLWYFRVVVAKCKISHLNLKSNKFWTPKGKMCGTIVRFYQLCSWR